MAGLMIPYSAREQRGWYMYDFANSAFSTTVVTLFLGPYLTIIAKAASDAQGYVHPFGIPVDHRSYWSYIVSLSVILQVIFLPMVGAVADYVAMLGLSRTEDYDDCQIMPSITNLLSANCDEKLKPSEITASDIAYLRGVYKMDAGATLQVQRDQIAGEMATALGGH